jgi:hypothetical protein
MKKLEKSKFHLSRETVYQLQDSALPRANGGFVPAESGQETCGTTTISCFVRCTG